MDKKKIIIISIFGVIIIGGIIGFLYYRNTPDYVMKQYVKANNNKNQKVLEKISYLENDLVLYDISEAYNKRNTSKIKSYNYWKTPSEDSVVFYCEYEDGEEHGLVNLKLINNKWRVIYSPLIHK